MSLIPQLYSHRDRSRGVSVAVDHGDRDQRTNGLREHTGPLDQFTVDQLRLMRSRRAAVKSKN
jgi:hypothetical protein